MKLAITMGQVFRGTLAQNIQKLGGEIIAQGFADSSTSWTVLANFPPRTKRRDVAQYLWTKYPGASVHVVPVVGGVIIKGRRQGKVNKNTDGTLSCTCSPDMVFYGGEGCPCGALQPQ
jgi:hypothetical protein